LTSILINDIGHGVIKLIYVRTQVSSNFGCNIVCFGSLSGYCSGCLHCEEECTKEEERYICLISEILKDSICSLIFSLLDLAFVTERKQLGTMLATVNKSQLNYSYEVLEKATNYFHNSNKLGQGGSGSVYKVISGLLYLRFFIFAN
jgi:hypothetical protein